VTSSKVFFISAQAERRNPRGMLHRMNPLFEAVGGDEIIEPGDLVAVKLSFSEWGNTACLRPQFVRQVVDGVKRAGGKPFLTDANTLYSGGRSNAVDHINTAIKNGFGYDAIGAPIIIADGLTGRSSKRVAAGTEHVKEPRIGAEVFHADALISLAHIHGHMGTGFAGTFKNVGMGLGCRAGKQEMHSQKEPPICEEANCVLCGDCARDCPVDAITLSSRSAVIDASTCIRCGECTTICPEGAIAIRWGDEPGMMQRRMVDYSKAVLRNKGRKTLFYAFLFDICPDCLCNDFNKPSIVPDLGILASRDPVAAEQAAFDMTSADADEFRKIYPEHDSEICMAYGQEIGLGSRDYTLVEI
jgi:uncharacterized Fe-S center protein